MEPLNDQELDQVLREWRTPDMPVGLEKRILAGSPWWRWLLAGSIRVPVPAGILALLFLALVAYSSLSGPKPVTLSDFQPVKQLEPRIIRSAHENR
jgi:hypothetical protein